MVGEFLFSRSLSIFIILFHISTVHNHLIFYFAQFNSSSSPSTLSWNFYFRRDLKDEDTIELASLIESLIEGSENKRE